MAHARRPVSPIPGGVGLVAAFYLCRTPKTAAWAQATTSRPPAHLRLLEQFRAQRAGLVALLRGKLLDELQGVIETRCELEALAGGHDQVGAHL